MLETDIDLIRDWIVLVMLGLSAIASLLVVAFIAVFILRVRVLLDTVKRTVDDVRVSCESVKGDAGNGC